MPQRGIWPPSAAENSKAAFLSNIIPYQGTAKAVSPPRQRPKPGDLVLQAHRAASAAQAPPNAGQIGPRPSSLRLLYHIRKPQKRFPRRASGQSRAIWFYRRTARRPPRRPRHWRGGLGQSPILCSYYTTKKRFHISRFQNPIKKRPDALSIRRQLSIYAFTASTSFLTASFQRRRCRVFAAIRPYVLETKFLHSFMQLHSNLRPFFQFGLRARTIFSALHLRF